MSGISRKFYFGKYMPFKALPFLMTVILFSFSIASASYINSVHLNLNDTQSQSPLAEPLEEELKAEPIIKQISLVLLEERLPIETINNYHYIDQTIRSGYLQQVDRPPENLLV